MIAIIDYGMGNLGSIRNMLTRIGAESVVTSDCNAIESADKLILPGVGAFDHAMERLHGLELVPLLRRRVLEQKVPILGICLGMQLLSRRSEEGTLPGLGWIDADTVRFRTEGTTLRLPHMGWSPIDVRRASPVLDDRFDDSRYYFVHSYHVRCDSDEQVLATCSYGIEFHAAVIRDNVIGTQFHPEKSHKYGLRLLRNFAEAGTLARV
jgi:imidazole glycerol-phosphate synthase subunit HisH